MMKMMNMKKEKVIWEKYQWNTLLSSTQNVLENIWKNSKNHHHSNAL
jgi:hypothetical protein